MSLYVYGVIPNSATVPTVAGVQGETLTTFASDGHTALISSLDGAQEIGTPDNLLAHSAVLDRVAAEGAVLPMVFGTVVPDEDALVEQVLAPRADLFEEHFARVGDAAQFTLQGRFVREQVLAELVDEEPEIAALSRTISGTSEDETREERIRLGELVVHGLERKAAGEADPIRAGLAPLALEVVEHEPGQADDVIELALLVERQRQADFERAAEDLARRLAGRVTLRLLGPQAPYDFVSGA